MAFLLGAGLGFLLFRQPAQARLSVPADVLKVAEAGGNEILQGSAPGKLNRALFTAGFTQQYTIEYNAFIRPISNPGQTSWEGAPTITWFGNGFLDVALPARTQAGIVMLELRMVRRQGNGWAVDRLLSIQLREATQ
jgi:hypothetical protein